VFISKSKYHKKNWTSYEKGKDKSNWAPFLVGGFWFLFNGMLLYGSLYILILLGVVFFVPDSMEILLKAIMTAINGLIIYKGNSLYYKFINSKIERAMIFTDDQDERIKILRREKLRNRVIGTIVSLLFFALIIWGSIYTYENQQIDQYLGEFDRLEVTKHEEKANELFNEILENSSEYSDNQVLDMLNETIIPNQEEVVSRIRKFELDEETRQIHKVYIEAEELELEAFTTIRNGIEQNNSRMVKTGFETFNNAYEKFSEFESLLDSLGE